MGRVEEYHAREKVFHLVLFDGEIPPDLTRSKIEKAIDKIISSSTTPFKASDLENLSIANRLRKEEGDSEDRYWEEEWDRDSRSKGHKVWLAMNQKALAKLSEHFQRVSQEAGVSSEEPSTVKSTPDHAQAKTMSSEEPSCNEKHLFEYSTGGETDETSSTARENTLFFIMHLTKSMQGKVWNRSSIEASIKQQLEAKDVDLDPQSNDSLTGALSKLDIEEPESADTHLDAAEAILDWRRIHLSFQQLNQNLGPVTSQVRRAITDAYKIEVLMWIMADMEESVASLRTLEDILAQIE